MRSIGAANQKQIKTVWFFDSAKKAQDEIGFKYKYSLRNGLLRLIEYREQVLEPA